MIRLPFITRLKRLFRRKRPADWAAFEARYAANLETLAGKMREVEAKHEAASDAVLASEVRGWIAESNAQAVKAALTSANSDKRQFLFPVHAPGVVTGKISPAPHIELPIGFRVEQIDGQTILICDAECQASRMADLQRIAELEAENHDLTEELDNLRTALRDRWASVLPKDGGGE